MCNFFRLISRFIMTVIVWGYIAVSFSVPFYSHYPHLRSLRMRLQNIMQYLYETYFKASLLESTTALVQFLSLLLGGILACFFGCVLSPDTANLFLSIQATLLTMHIAFLALFSGVLQEAYLKVSYANFFLNLKPKFYKQKRTILASLGCLLLSCVFYVCGAHNMNAAFLVCEMAFIAISTHIMYGVFEDKERIKQEIWEYVYEKQFQQDRISPASRHDTKTASRHLGK